MGWFVNSMVFDLSPDFKVQLKVPASTALDWYMKKMYDLKIIGLVQNQC